MTIWVARLETRNFTFDAYGCTEGDAISVMRWGWMAHRQNTGATMKWDEVKGDVVVRKVQVGSCYRDGDTEMVYVVPDRDSGLRR